ncbi:MAG: hypothetical protein P8K27_01345 [Gammaproteobacteria bacterium]|nr:hypothetical protein [Gammaproteobacteria bacterium]
MLVISLMPDISHSSNEDSFNQNLMKSGLRRSLALDAPLGDLLMRNMSYRFFSLSNRNDNGTPNQDSLNSSSKIAQFNSLLSMGNNEKYKFFLQTTARHADFEIDNYFRSSAKRFDIGLLATKSNTNTNPSASYFGANIIAESNVGRPESMPMSRSGDGIGIRLEGGQQINEKWSLSGKVEFLDWQGTHKMQSMAAGAQDKRYDVTSNRIYANFDIIRSFSWLGGQSHWRTGAHYLRYDYDKSLSKDKSSFIEPFGDNETISVARTSFLQTWPIRSASDFNFFIEIDLDFEIDNDMHNLNSDRFGLNHKIGMLWAPRMGSRLRLEYHNFEGRQGLAKREGLMLVLLFDGI